MAPRPKASSASSALPKPLPTGVTLREFDIPTETAGFKNQMRNETKALMDDPRCKVGSDVIPVFIANDLDPDVAGFANTPSYMVPSDTGYGGAVFVNSGHALESVLSHELAHILLDAQHAPSPYALWNSYFTGQKCYIWWGDISLAHGTWSEIGISAHRHLSD